MLQERDNSALAKPRGPPDRMRLNPGTLLLTKWTAVDPRRKEKHFIVTRVIQPEEPETEIQLIALEAVYSRRSWIFLWRDLTNCAKWLQGWK